MTENRDSSRSKSKYEQPELDEDVDTGPSSTDDATPTSDNSGSDSPTTNDYSDSVETESSINSSDPDPTPVNTPPKGPFMSEEAPQSQRSAVLAQKWRASRRRYARDKLTSVSLTGLAIIVVIIISGFVWNAFQPPKPVQAADDFFSALQDGELDEALQLTDVSERDIDGFSLLDSNSFSTGWEVDDINLVYERNVDTDKKQAEVKVTLRAANGTAVESPLKLRTVGGDWRLVDPLARVSIDSRLVPYLTVNGESVDLRPEYSGESTVTLFPGVYDFSVEREGIFISENTSFIGVGTNVALLDDRSGEISDRDSSDSHHISLNVEIHPEVQDFVQQKVDQLVTNCNSRLDILEFSKTNIKCPFGYTREDLNTLAGHDHYAHWDRMEWGDFQAPAVSLTWSDEAEGNGFILETISEGYIEFTGVGDSSSANAEVDFMCSYGVELITVTLSDDEEFDVRSYATWHEDTSSECSVVD